jgi:hypothetical protein
MSQEKATRKNAALSQKGEPKSDSPKKTPKKSRKGTFIEETANAFLTAIKEAEKAEIRPSEKVSAALLKLIDATSKYATPSPAPPFTPLPPQQMPTTWQIAQLAVLIGQSHPEKLRALAIDLPDDLTAAMSETQDGYQIANALTSAALMLLRSAHDMRQVWQQQPKLQQNHQAGWLFLFRPNQDEQEDRQSRVLFILANLLAPNPSDSSRFDEQTERYWSIKDSRGQSTPDKQRFAEYWHDMAFVTWSDAAILFFREAVPANGQMAPGKATKRQGELFKTFVAEYLNKTTPHEPNEKIDTAYFIKAWQKTTANTPDEERPTLLQPGNFMFLWHGLIEYFETRAKERRSEEMKEVRKGRKKGERASL